MREHPDKAEFLATLLSGHRYVDLLVDGRHPDIDIPADFWESAMVQLQIGFDLPLPIEDITIHGVTGLSCTLHFPRTGFHLCKIPWSAVYQISTPKGPGHLWEGEVPADVRRFLRREGEERTTAPETPKSRKRKGSHLRLVKAPRPDEPPEPTAA